MQEKDKIWVEAWNVRLDWLIKLKKKTIQHSSIQKENSNYIKSNIIKYISSSSTLQCNLIEGPFVYKVMGALGDLRGSPQKCLSIWRGAEIKILKTDRGAKEKRTYLKEQ